MGKVQSSATKTCGLAPMSLAGQNPRRQTVIRERARAGKLVNPFKYITSAHSSTPNSTKKGTRKPVSINGPKKSACSRSADVGQKANELCQVDVFAKDAILVPINLGNAHWTFACVNMRLKRVEYYDSLGSRRSKVYEVSWLLEPTLSA